jgi:hypothetical protein
VAEVTKDWIGGLDARAFEKVLALGLYHYRSQLLFIHTNEWFHAHFQSGKTEKQQLEIFSEFFVPYFLMWASMVYVVHEGFVDLDIEDARLQRATKATDVALLKRFRNATFHYQPHVRSPKHDEYIKTKGFGAVRTLFDRQGVLVRRMARLLKYNPHYGNAVY